MSLLGLWSLPPPLLRPWTALPLEAHHSLLDACSISVNLLSLTHSLCPSGHPIYEMSEPLTQEDLARAERKAARRAKRAASEAERLSSSPPSTTASLPTIIVSEPMAPSSSVNESLKSSTTAAPTTVSSSSASHKSRHHRNKHQSVEDDAYEGGADIERPATRTAADEEFLRQVRRSLDINRGAFPHDARKSLEKPATADDLRASADFRRSFDTEGESGRFSASVDRPTSRESFSVKASSMEQEMEKGNAEDDLLKTFPISEGLSQAQADELLKQYGRNELPEKSTPKWFIFCSLLWQPMPVMIWIAAIIEAAIGDWIDTIVLAAINLLNATLGFYETTKAGDAVAALKASLKPTASCFRDGAWDNKFDARFLVPGDLVELASGAAVPADCMINSGTIDVDESAMTGESLPATLHEREMAKMGGTVTRGEVHATVVFTGKDTFFGKTASMLGGSEGYSNLQKLLLKIIVVLCVLAFVLCLTAFIYLIARYKNGKDAISFAVIVLVASIPMAVEIVTTSTLAIGSRQMSKHGAIVSRLAAIEDLAGLNMLCSDKTGTLTKNKMTIQADAPTYTSHTNQMDLLKQAALAAKWESPPKDALDTLFLRCHLWCPDVNQRVDAQAAEHPDWKQNDRETAYNDLVNQALQAALSDYESLAFMPFDPRIKRTESTVREKSTGRIFKVRKKNFSPLFRPSFASFSE